jgi:hypothetical protein
MVVFDEFPASFRKVHQLPTRALAIVNRFQTYTGVCVCWC